MKRTYWMGLTFLFIGLLGVPHFCLAQPESRKYLLRGTQGELPSDVGDEATRATIGEHREIGGKCIQVGLRNSIGVSKSKVADWKPYRTLALDIVAEKDLTLIFTIRHPESTATLWNVRR